MIRQLAHLCLKTDQLPEMIAFYRDVLGAAVQFRYMNRAGECVGCYLALGNATFLEIFDHTAADQRMNPDKAPQKLESPSDPWLQRYNHFCLQVDHLYAWVETLRQRGAVVTGRKTGNDQSEQAWTKDPDGNLIEFQEYTARSRQFTGEDFREP